MDEKKPTRTGVPSIDRPWMQYYPPQLIENLEVPNQTVEEYLRAHCPGEDVVAIHYYGNDITWKELFEQVDQTARGLKALGLGEGDSIPTFLRAVPEFVYHTGMVQKHRSLCFCLHTAVQIMHPCRHMYRNISIACTQTNRHTAAEPCLGTGSWSWAKNIPAK